jgi:endonuclease YncB( thermonuclease family)
MTKDQKNEVIEILKGKFSQYNNFYITDTESLSVEQISNLRRSCFNKEVEMKVYDFKLTRVLDGDTVGFEAKFLPDPLKKELLIRVYGVDTPEKGHRAQCPQENTKGLAATEFTKTTIANGKKIQVAIATWDKFGGRVLGDVLIDGKSLRVALIKNGYAREYYGLAKESWCN